VLETTLRTPISVSRPFCTRTHDILNVTGARPTRQGMRSSLVRAKFPSPRLCSDLFTTDPLSHPRRLAGPRRLARSPTPHPLLPHLPPRHLGSQVQLLLHHIQHAQPQDHRGGKHPRIGNRRLHRSEVARHSWSGAISSGQGHTCRTVACRAGERAAEGQDRGGDWEWM
jgi:hypothetical protein